MLERHTGKTLLLLTATALLFVRPAYPAQAASAPAGGQGHLALVGCWELIVGDAESDFEPLEGERRVCLVANEDPNVLEFTSLVDGEAVLQRQLLTDGVERPVEDGGCSGTESARRSRDGRRVFRRAEMACQGGNSRVTSGISLLADANHWVDINVIGVGESRELLIRRYRAAAAQAEPDGEAGDFSALRLAVHTARIEAATALTADDVIEALEQVDSAAVEAMLLETRPEFPLDSQLLLHLADADVPAGIVDLMVALTYPDYFDIGAVGDDDVGSQQARGTAPAAVFYAGGGSYWSPWFAPFGYGYYHPQPSILVVAGARFGGKVVRGRGYTRVRASNLPSGGIRRLFKGRGGRSSSGGKARPAMGSSASSGGSGGGTSKTTTRKAKPRGTS